MDNLLSLPSYGTQNLASCRATTHINKPRDIQAAAITPYADSTNQHRLSNSPSAYMSPSNLNGAIGAGPQHTPAGPTAAYPCPGNSLENSLNLTSNTISSSNKNSHFKVNTCSRLFVGRLPPLCTEEQLSAIFGGYGNLLEVKVMREVSGRSKGSAWVRYENEEMARRAIEALHEKWIFPTQTNALRVQFAVPPKKGGTPITFASPPALPSTTAYPIASYPATVYASPQLLGEPAPLSVAPFPQGPFYGELTSSPAAYYAPPSTGPTGAVGIPLGATPMWYAQVTAQPPAVTSYAYPAALGAVLVKQGEGYLPLLQY
ncbi:unnamed protein product [Phytomonas sp. EM1]|nr:unnamed protein product [Phytomonas sp. EM1]|eukprot:CCW61230.1 unnamed protein product [Phytomonas sp. isolate EM1]